MNRSEIPYIYPELSMIAHIPPMCPAKCLPKTGTRYRTRAAGAIRTSIPGNKERAHTNRECLRKVHAGSNWYTAATG